MMDNPEGLIAGYKMPVVDINGRVCLIHTGTGYVEYLGDVSTESQAVLTAAIAWAEQLEEQGRGGPFPNTITVPGDLAPLYDAVRAWRRAKAGAPGDPTPSLERCDPSIGSHFFKAFSGAGSRCQCGLRNFPY